MRATQTIISITKPRCIFFYTRKKVKCALLFCAQVLTGRASVFALLWWRKKKKMAIPYCWGVSGSRRHILAHIELRLPEPAFFTSSLFFRRPSSRATRALTAEPRAFAHFSLFFILYSRTKNERNPRQRQKMCLFRSGVTRARGSARTLHNVSKIRTPSRERLTFFYIPIFLCLFLSYIHANKNCL